MGNGPIQSKYFDETVQTLPSMEGKTVAVTGCSSGTGLCLARTVAARGARVVLLNRPSSRAEAALAAVKESASDSSLITHVDCDLMDFDAVRAAADKLLADGTPIDVLVNNAGIMAFTDQATKDGYDCQMQTNHLSHFLLTARVFPLLQKAAAANGEARVVNHSSIARERANGVQDEYYGKNGGNLGGDKNGFMLGSGPRWTRYSQTKLANIAFTLALRDRIAAEGPDSPNAKILSLCAHPGVAATSLATTTSGVGGLGGFSQKLVRMISQSTEDGTLGILRCACDKGIPSGSLVGPVKRTGPAVVMDAAKEEQRVPPQARERVWKMSVEATAVADFFPPKDQAAAAAE